VAKTGQLTQLQPLKRVLKWQATICLLITIFAAGSQGMHSAVSVGYGSIIVMVNTLLMIWHIWRAAKTAGADAEQNLSRAYRCVAERWLNAIVMFAVGMLVLKLNFTALMVGFIATQLMLFMGQTNRASNRNG
jgi:ATP synthase protein I